ncbi:MAG: hypothetical protein ABJQ29_07610 [Luteolibacter sp.]
MSIRNFIGASSALLLVWLGVTFFHDVPVNRYQSEDVKTVELSEDTTEAVTVLVSVAKSEN